MWQLCVLIGRGGQRHLRLAVVLVVLSLSENLTASLAQADCDGGLCPLVSAPQAPAASDSNVLLQAASHHRAMSHAAHTHLTMNIAGQGERGGEREKRPKTILVSHRSCSEDQSLQCSKGFIAEMKKMAAVAAQYPIINETHLFTRLPDTISSDPRWARHIQPGIKGRGFWFWKPAIINMLLKEGLVNDGDHVIYLDGDTSHFMQRILDAASDEIDFQTYWQEHCEYSWTKGDVFARLE
ncbi:unnamed protein product [Polarella glacialis]|uniref:Uncharacterized protein n=1 Tax=Polarella glacialis TaxID=89957 RepID=A0A813H475_POLGL|nr:unnamed protein product [Polarella glacialis]